MTDADPLATEVEAVAAETTVAADRLRELVDAQQRLVCDHEEVGGVDGLVYEYRRYLPEDPLVEQTDAAYYLAVRDRVWADFAARLDATDEEVDALRDVHRRAFETERGQGPADRFPLVFGRD